MSDVDADRNLRMSLLMSDPEAIRAYTHNAEFKGAIDMIAQAWPMMLDAMVKTAKENELRQAALMRQMMAVDRAGTIL